MASLAVAGSTHPDTDHAIAESIGQLVDLGFSAGESSVALVFASGRHVDGLARVSVGLARLLGVPSVIACSTEGVVLGRVVHRGDAVGIGVVCGQAVTTFGASAGSQASRPPGATTLSVATATADLSALSGEGLIGACLSGAPARRRLMIDGASARTGVVGVHFAGDGVAPFAADGWDPYPTDDGPEPGSDLQTALATAAPGAQSALVIINRGRRADLWADPEPDAAIVHETTATGNVIGMISSAEVYVAGNVSGPLGPAAVGLLFTDRLPVAFRRAESEEFP